MGDNTWFENSFPASSQVINDTDEQFLSSDVLQDSRTSAQSEHGTTIAPNTSNTEPITSSTGPSAKTIATASTVSSLNTDVPSTSNVDGSCIPSENKVPNTNTVKQSNNSGGPSTGFRNYNSNVYSKIRYPYPRDWEKRSVRVLGSITRKDEHATVFAVVKRFKGPQRSRGPDFSMFFHVTDETLDKDQSLECVSFLRNAEDMPLIENPGDIIKLPIRVSWYNGKLQLRTFDKIYPWITFDGRPHSDIVPRLSQCGQPSFTDKDKWIVKRLKAWAMTEGIVTLSSLTKQPDDPHKSTNEAPTTNEEPSSDNIPTSNAGANKESSTDEAAASNKLANEAIKGAMPDNANEPPMDDIVTNDGYMQPSQDTTNFTENDNVSSALNNPQETTEVSHVDCVNAWEVLHIPALNKQAKVHNTIKHKQQKLADTPMTPQENSTVKPSGKQTEKQVFKHCIPAISFTECDTQWHVVELSQYFNRHTKYCESLNTEKHQIATKRMMDLVRNNEK